MRLLAEPSKIIKTCAIASVQAGRRQFMIFGGNIDNVGAYTFDIGINILIPPYSNSSLRGDIITRTITNYYYNTSRQILVTEISKFSRRQNLCYGRLRLLLDGRWAAVCHSLAGDDIFCDDG